MIVVVGGDVKIRRHVVVLFIRDIATGVKGNEVANAASYTTLQYHG